MAEIYLTTNLINNKKYIGQSKHNNKNYLGSGKLLKLAIKKYGRENFVKSVLLQGDLSYDILNSLEKSIIRYYNADKSEEFYNIAEGGNNCGVPHTKTHREWLRGWKENPIYKINQNKKLHKEIIKKANFKSTLITRKKVYEFDSKFNFIKEFKSVAEASRYYNINASMIANRCRHNSKNNHTVHRIKNRIFSYSEVLNLKTKSQRRRELNFKKIINTDSSYIFESVQEACKFFNLSKEAIRRHCLKQNKKFNLPIMYYNDWNKNK